MRLGIAHHLGWAIVVTASDEHEVVDRRRIELVPSGTASAPIHHEGKGLDDVALAALVGEVRSTATEATNAAIAELVTDLPGSIRSMSLRAWPVDFPQEIEVLRRVPYEARADSVMYRQILAGAAEARGWDLHLFDARTVEADAAARLGRRADAVLQGPRRELGPPWAKDHRMALAATVLAGL